ncbi:VIT family-domain-containing protein [Podospora didyma]|uniref:VIT family-domain-containing protein n=1 Tax=Podospora didyma TaxID=330526 RepID=A0AAE0N245_9PEZI|nr:VIT family-domain-containing protein [Podospora didyma]
MDGSWSYLNRFAKSGEEDVLPVYASVPNPASPSRNSQSSTSTIVQTDTSIHNDISEKDTLSPTPRHRVLLPSLKRFLADFTLGFADGLTVPFALTAGLSSLGQTSTVIYAGMAEICAGSISMGVGGYLAARGDGAGSDEPTVARDSSNSDDDNARHGSEESAPLQRDEEDLNEKARSHRVSQFELESDNLRDVMVQYLDPLRLPPHLVDAVWSHVCQQGDAAGELSSTLSRHPAELPAEEEHTTMTAILSGLSVSVGYLLGGSLPLFPYFFVTSVGDGLMWSFIVCVVALFVFGFTKHYVLSGERTRHTTVANGQDWRRIRGSTWEGFQMVVLGSLAAIAAVLCVRLFDGAL